MSRRSRKHRVPQSLSHSNRGKTPIDSSETNERNPLSKSEIRSFVQEELLVARAELFAGPLPHPDHLAEYEKIHSGSADRILRMAEDEAQHRHRIESIVIESNVKLEARGQLFGFLIAVTALAGGIWIMASGYSLWGAAMVTVAVTGLSGLFIWARREKKRESSGRFRTGTAPGSAAPPGPPQRLGGN